MTGVPPNGEVAGGTFQRETAWGAKAQGLRGSLGTLHGGWGHIHCKARTHFIKITALFDIFSPKSCLGAQLFVWDHSQAGVREGSPHFLQEPPVQREERHNVLDDLWRNPSAVTILSSQCRNHDFSAPEQWEYSCWKHLTILFLHSNPRAYRHPEVYPSQQHQPSLCISWVTQSRLHSCQNTPE